MITIEYINHTTGQETMHPLICVVDKMNCLAPECSGYKCDFYALTMEKRNGSTSLRLSIPGDIFPDYIMGNGVYFHPDLLCDTPLESEIACYPRRCHCKDALSTDEIALIDDCFGKIRKELSHPIDRFSAMILSSHIELLLNYCVRICS